MKYIVWFSWWTDSVFVSWKLKQEGHEVLLVNLKNTVEKNKCCQVPTTLFNIANSLNLPLKIVDAQEDFRKYVIEDFINKYKNWKTPNPCINCNEFVRFKILENVRKNLWYDFITTGHYVKKEKIDDFYTFSIPKDKTKDQTYMLYALVKYQNILKNLQFPMWDYLKEDVKKIIEKENIPVNTKEESQNICFIIDDDYPKYIKEQTNIKIPSWNIIDTKWNVLWKHNGFINYTIGQRKWLDVNINKRKYVVKIDPVKNEITVWEDQDLFSKKVCVDSLYILSKKYELYGKVRYKSKLEKIDNIDWDCVYFKKAIRAITPWQYLVVYWKKNNNYFVLWWWEII